MLSVAVARSSDGIAIRYIHCTSGFVSHHAMEEDERNSRYSNQVLVNRPSTKSAMYGCLVFGLHTGEQPVVITIAVVLLGVIIISVGVFMVCVWKRRRTASGR